MPVAAPARTLRATSWTCLAALLATACGATPDADRPTLGPALRASLEHHAGPPMLAGRWHAADGAFEADGDPASALAVEAVVRVVEHRPRAGLRSLADTAVLIAAVDEASPIRTVAGPTRAVLYATGADAEALGAAIDAGEHGTHRTVHTLAGALLAGTTVSIDVERQRPSTMTDEALAVREAGGVRVHRPARDGDGARSGNDDTRLSGAGTGAGQDAGQDDSAGDGAPRVLAAGVVTGDGQREIALVELPPVPASDTLAVVLPWPVVSEDGAAVVVSLAIGPPPDPGTPAGRAHARTVARALADLARRAAPQATAASLPPGLLSALRGLLEATPAIGTSGADDEPPPSDTEGQRGTLAYLAAATGAGLAQDVALSAEPPAVDALARAVLAAWPADGPAARTPAVLGATLEIAAYRLLLDDALPDDVPPAHEALLVLHAGEVGRSQALLSEILADEPALDALQARIVAENLAFLESNAPSSRVRACDWLAGRGRAPAGYDPLAPREERRAALATAVTAAPP